MQEWDIKPRSEACHKCETPFHDKEKYTATLVFGEGGYSRTDYCKKCWESTNNPSLIYSVWNGVFKMPPPPEEEALKKETAESLLRKLMEQEDLSKINAIYILAIMLERKRILVERSVQVDEDGKTTRFYEHKKTGETFLIPDPHLNLDELEHVQEEVVVLLGGKIPVKKNKTEQSDSNEENEAPSDEKSEETTDKVEDVEDDEDEYEDEDS